MWSSATSLWSNPMTAGEEGTAHFISSFCQPNVVPGDWKNQLGRFTPCFADVIVLGLSEVTAIVLCMLRLRHVYGEAHSKVYRMYGSSRALQSTSLLAAIFCTLVPLMQLAARLGARAVLPTTPSSGIAPYEICSYLLAAAAFACLSCVLAVDMEHYSPRRIWLIRFPIVLVAAAQVAKLHFVLALKSEHDLFFWLYIAYVAAQLYIAALALFAYPSEETLKRQADPSVPDLTSYQPLAGEDEQPPVAENVCPEAKANLFSTITFSWLSPLLWQGYKAPLQQQHIWRLPDGDSSATLTAAFQRHWDDEMHRRNASITRACWRTVKWLFIVALPFKLTNDLSQFVGPVFLNKMLDVIDRGNYKLAYLYAFSMFLGLVLGTLADNQHFQRVMRAGFRLRSVLVGEIFQKVLFLAPGARSEFSSGRIFNLVTSDAETIQQLCQSIFGFISSPLRIAGAMLLLYNQLGVSSLVALVVLLLFMPMQAYMVRLAVQFLRAALGYTDERTKLEGELIGGIDAIKCAAWEEAFNDRINNVRRKELSTLWKSFVVASVNAFLLQTIPALVSVATFTVYVLLGNNLTAAKAFVSLSLLNVLRLPLFQLPQLITQFTQARVATRRLQEFLSANSQPPRRVLPAASDLGQRVGKAVILEGDFSWNDDSAPALKNINLSAHLGEYIAIVGTTGSGKTSVLASLLDLTVQVSGSPPIIRGKVAYVPQSPFIFNATVRDNILFGQEYDEQRYWAAIDAASLGRDLIELPAGDLTELGDRGVNVSGGQKQRISIARAVYADAHVYLLDDPLSALDARVAREVYHNCVRGALRQKTVLLVTNQLQFIQDADRIVYMSDGEMQESGKFAELMDHKAGFARLMQDAQVEDAEDGDTVKENGTEGESDAILEKLNSTDVVSSQKQPSKAAVQQQQRNANQDASGGQLMTTESRAVGVVAGRVLNAYIMALGGMWAFTILISLFLVVEACRVGATVWLSFWTNDTATYGKSTPHGAMWYLAIYAAITAGQVVMTLINQFNLKALSLRAANALHNGMLRRLIAAPMSFFHTTPQGRIINRLTKDTSDVDKNLADFGAFFFRSFLQLVSTVLLVGIITPFTLPLLVPILLMFYFLYVYFQSSVREVKRLDALTRSPVYSSIGEALAGLATIRAFRAEQRLIERNQELVDNNIVMTLVNNSMNRWLSVRLETLGALAALAAAVMAVEQSGGSSSAGLTVSYALSITALTSMTVRAASLAENSFNAVERMLEYSDIEQEKARVIEGSVPRCWPADGAVELRDVRMRYRPGLPLVLRGVSVSIAAGSKCGVVGRTGAGKSSLVGCLFRLTELDGGEIVIDGKNIANIGLKQLRSAMSIIPQTPVLFTGTLRYNMSPNAGEHSDAEIWTALRRAHLASVIEAHPMGLDMVLQEGGAPLSAGQKQLVALARALLRRSKVLVMDEATAAVDVETDALIQKTVREEFGSCTVICIAHRLHTIIDGGIVMVLDHGQLAECGSPAQLLSNPSGEFSGMVRETGKATERFLREVAFGEASLSAVYDASAEKGKKKLERAMSMAQAATTMSHQLLDRARAAVGTLRLVLESLDEQADEEHLRRELGLPAPQVDVDRNEEEAVVPLMGTRFADAHGAIAEALQLVDDVYRLAEAAHAKFAGTQCHLVATAEDGAGSGPSVHRMLSRSISTPVRNLSEPTRHWSRVRAKVRGMIAMSRPRSGVPFASNDENHDLH